MPLIKVGKKRLLPLLNLREAVLMLTYEPHKLKEGMADLIEHNIEEWILQLEKKEKNLGIDQLNMFEEQKRQIAGIVGHYKRNIEGRYERRKWLCKHFGLNWRMWHQPRPSPSGINI